MDRAGIAISFFLGFVWSECTWLPKDRVFLCATFALSLVFNFFGAVEVYVNLYKTCFSDFVSGFCLRIHVSMCMALKDPLFYCVSVTQSFVFLVLWKVIRFFTFLILILG